MRASEVELDDHPTAIDFHDIVDKDEDHDHQYSTRMFAGLLIESLPFRIGILAAIVLNSIVIGLQTNKQLEARYGALLMGLDTFFHTLFAMEILIKWYHDFLGFWRVGWNIFDFVIVAVSFFVPGVGFLSGSRILHVLRILHATRSLRSISTLQGLQTVVQTVMYSIPDMANVMWLLLICTFIFAILGNSVFGDDCPEHFVSVERTMFSLFICVTQDGWLTIADEFRVCGHNILGPIYLVVYITLGAFVFANLVVAVVVTNLEWVIEQKNERIKKIIRKKDATELPSGACKELFNTASTHIPKKFERRSLDKYLVFLGSLEDNFAEFKRLKSELTKIEQEIQALEVLDEVSNEELIELSNMLGPDAKSLRKPSRINLGGDAITEMLGMLQKSPQTGQAKSIHHMITQLVQRKPSSEFNPSRRPSFLAQAMEHTAMHRPAGDGDDTQRPSQQRRSSDQNDQGPYMQGLHVSGNLNSIRRHTVSSVPGFRVKSHKK